jgi:two-component system NtrC family sensor kinase
MTICSFHIATPAPPQVGIGDLVTATQTQTERHADHVARLEAQVTSLREELRRSQRLATVGTMAAMVAHEFNNILTPIINYAELAKSNPNMVEKAIARAAEGGVRATQICKALLGITSDRPDEPARENLRNLVDQVLSAMARDPGKDGIDLDLSGIPEDLAITTRRVEMQQVLLNMLVNARTAVLATGRSRRIALSASQDATWVTIEVADNGVGVGPDILDKIFKPFFTTNGKSGPTSEGFGLGLAICSEIVESMGGEIAVTSTVDEGTTFTIRLPA